VVCSKFSDVSDKHAAFFFKVGEYTRQKTSVKLYFLPASRWFRSWLEDGGDMFLQNVG
jgi:hypothetical protein